MRYLRGVVLLGVVLCAHAARAQAPLDADQVEQAKKFFAAGKQAYEAGQYGVAQAAFEAAYRLSPRPPILFSMAQAYRRQYVIDRDPARLRRAVELYREYIVEVPAGGRREDAVQYVADLEPVLNRLEDEEKRAGKGPILAATTPPSATTQIMVSSRTKGARGTLDGGKANELPILRDVAPGKHLIHVEAPGYFADEVEGIAVDGRLVVVELNLREKPARLALTTDRGAELSVDGRPVGRAPFLRPIGMPHGKHYMVLTKRGHYAVTRELQVLRGQELHLDAPLEKTVQRVVSYYVLGGAGLLALGGGAATLLALGKQAHAKDILDIREVEGRNLTQAELDRYENQRMRRDRWFQASYVLYGAAAALSITGGLLYYVDTPRIEPPQAGVVPLLGADGMGAAALFTF